MEGLRDCVLVCVCFVLWFLVFNHFFRGKRLVLLLDFFVEHREMGRRQHSSFTVLFLRRYRTTCNAVWGGGEMLYDTCTLNIEKDVSIEEHDAGTINDCCT